MALVKHAFPVTLAILSLVALPAEASAERKSGGGGGGVLSRNVDAVKSATSSSDSGGGASDSDSGYDSSDEPYYDDGSGRHGHYHGGYVAHVGPPPPAFVAMPYATYTRGPEVSLYLGLQNVKDLEGSDASTAAASVSVRASVDDFGVGLSDSIYYETYPGMDPLTMHLWSLNGLFRIARLGPSDHTAIWLTGGFAGLQSTAADLQLYGAGLGAEIAHNFGDAAGIEGSARIIALQEGMRAVEYRVGVAASVIRLSYRYLKLNVDAPALKGPELGVALHF